MSEFDQVVQDGKTILKKRVRRWLFYVLLLGVAGVAGYLLVCNFTYSKGSRIGYVMKISQKGFVFKTYEGTLNLATRNDFGVQTWDFSASNRATYQRIAESEGKRVMLYYKQKLKVMPWQGDTPYLVYEVRAVKN
ncbi:MAG: hypothetical protein ACKOAY_03330 [Haliscomenobacter sp.]